MDLDWDQGRAERALCVVCERCGVLYVFVLSAVDLAVVRKVSCNSS